MKFKAALFKANSIAFISSFCVMIIELVAARIMAPYIGVSLYTWTSIIGVILAGIALGNYAGGKLADRYPNTLVLALIFFIGSLLTLAILPVMKLVAGADWFNSLPVMLNFVVKVCCIFLLPAFVLSATSPVVIKLALADIRQTGGTVGLIYAFSTAGAILGTFLTGFYLILWFGTRTLVLITAAVLFLTGILIATLWRVPKVAGSRRSTITKFLSAIIVLALGGQMFFFPQIWQESFTKESDYYAIRVTPANSNADVLFLDRLEISYIIPDDPKYLAYDYLKVIANLIAYSSQANPTPATLHLGAGGYALPRYMEATYPGSKNDVIEIDPEVTRVNYELLGLPRTTKIKSYNEDARLFFIQQQIGNQYDFIIGDVFKDFATPYHLTTLEFDKIIKANLKNGGIYLVNIIDDYESGKYMPSFVYTLKHAFNYVYLLDPIQNASGLSNFIIAASDQPISLENYITFLSRRGDSISAGRPWTESEMTKLLTERNPILLTDDHAPTDILVAPLISGR
jgi:MFS family permease